MLVIPLTGFGQNIITLHELKVSDVYPLATRSSRTAPLTMFSVNGGTMQPIGLLGENLEPYLRTHAGANQLLLDYRKKTRTSKTIGKISSYVGSAGILTFLIAIDPDHRSTFSTAQFVGLGAMTAAAGVNLAIVLPGFNKARGMFNESVRVYNTEQLR